MNVIDITHPVDEHLASWPGDEPYAFRFQTRLAEGDTVNLGAITFSLHTGTHADAPFHFREGAATIGEIDPSVFIGPARVVDVRGRNPIRRADLEGLDLEPRILFRTDAWLDSTRFPESVPVMEPELPDWLRERGVVLVGVDVPSVDALDSPDLPIHHALGRCDIQILESLRLVEVPAGPYELIALPLKLLGADGSPVRAILRTP